MFPAISLLFSYKGIAIMINLVPIYLVAAGLSLYVLYKTWRRLQLSKAKHPSLTGHSKMARRLARLVPYYEFNEQVFFSSDGAPTEVVKQRRNAFHTLAAHFRDKAPRGVALSNHLENSVSDLMFTNNYRVPYQFARYVRENIKLSAFVTETLGSQVKDLDGNWSYDLSGSYGVNVFGFEFYKDCLRQGMERVKDVGPVLGPYHPLIVDNVDRLIRISGLDEVSFHMSGTEAVMQAVRLARYHTGKTHLVRFCGAYHGWWDGVQPGIGNTRKTSDVYTLKDMDKDTLRVLRTRKDIACVLINPLQAMHPNANAPADSMLVASGRGANYQREQYRQWLQELRKVCDQRGIVMIMDEVFVGFRLARGGAQEYFGVRADLVTYGKTLGGGLPIGVVCGKHRLMKRFKEHAPLDVSFARGTFNSHPCVMATMNEFLTRIESKEIMDAYASVDTVWNARVADLNNRLQRKQLPIKVENLASIWTVLYTRPSRYNWMFQFYLRAYGLAISWVGSGRFIMSHSYTDAEYEAVMLRFVAAAEAMEKDGWWWQAVHLSNKAIGRQVLRETFFALGQRLLPSKTAKLPAPDPAPVDQVH